MLSVEMPLLQAQLKQIDKALEKGQKHLTWRSHAIDEFVRETTTLVKEAFDTLTALKNNMHGVERVLEQWATVPLMKRKSTKTYTPSEFEEEHQMQLAARYAEISEGGKEIHKLLLASNRVLKVSKGAPTWRAYVEFINDIVIDGLARTVACSLKYLNEQLDPAEILQNETVALLEVQLELEGTSITYWPELADANASSNKTASLHAMVDNWIKGFFHVCKLVKRLDRTEGDFLKEVAESEEVRMHVHNIKWHVVANEEECNLFKEPFIAYKPLWTKAEMTHPHFGTTPLAAAHPPPPSSTPSGPTMPPPHSPPHPATPLLPSPTQDVNLALNHFLADNVVPTEDEGEEGATPIPSGLVGSLATLKPEPPLVLFDRQIGLYKQQATAINMLQGSRSLGWLKVDAKPVKQALATWVTKWQFRYTSYLHDSVTGALNDLDTFMKAINEGLLADVEPDDSEALLQAMTCIRDVRLRTELVNSLFEPLRGKAALLKKYDLMLSEDYLDMLDQAPFNWDVTRKATYNARERLSPLQALQAEKIKERSEDFGLRVSDFRSGFLKEVS